MYHWSVVTVGERMCLFMLYLFYCSLIHSVFGFGLLFQEASVALLDTSLHDEITDWQYTAIISAYLSQGHRRMALTFMTLKNEWSLNSDDIGMRLKVLQANGFVNYKRKCMFNF